MIIKKNKILSSAPCKPFLSFLWSAMAVTPCVWRCDFIVFHIHVFSGQLWLCVCYFFCTLGALCAKISVLNNIHTHRRSVLSCEQKNTQNQRKLCGLFSIYGPASSVCECCLYFIFGYGIAWYSVVLSIYSCSHAHPPPAQTYTHTESMLATNDDICCTRRWFTAEYEM